MPVVTLAIAVTVITALVLLCVATIWIARLRHHSHENDAKIRALEGNLAESALRHDALQKELQAAAVKLAEAHDLVEGSKRLKATFLTNINHELRTPINLIVGFSEAMLSPMKADQIPGAYWSDLSVINRNARYLQALIENVLSASQVEEGQVVPIKEAVDPCVVINEAIDLVRDLIASKGLTLQVDVPDQLPTMWLDKVRIRHVLLDLLSNAVRFTEQGTVTLKAESNDGALHIVVHDTGEGIPREQLETIFEEYRQAANTPYRSSGGLGLGLALCKQFVQLHHGQIRAESSGIPGEGSTFIVQLPLESVDFPVQGGAQNALYADADHKNQQETLIVLDEDPNILELFKLNMPDFKVVGVTTIEEATAHLRSTPAKALIVSSVSAHSEIPTLTQSLARPISVITCSLSSSRHLMEMEGIAGFLVKPVTYHTLKAALDNLGRPIKNVLIIDDNREVVRMFARMLKAMPQNYQIWQAYGGREGLAVLREAQPDVIILDLLMPDIDGLTFTQFLRADPRLVDIPVLLASAQGDPDIIAPTSNNRISLMHINSLRPVELVRYIQSMIKLLN